MSQESTRMGKRKAGKNDHDWGMHIQPEKDGTMEMNTPDRCSALPDPPSNAAVTTYVYDGYGNLLRVDEAPATLARLAELESELLRKPNVEITRDPARHVIKITGRDGKTALFEDKPIRYLVMDRNPQTKALEPVIIFGEPLYYYLAREVGGGVACCV